MADTRSTKRESVKRKGSEIGLCSKVGVNHSVYFSTIELKLKKWHGNS
jgi:hypothetical protein